MMMSREDWIINSAKTIIDYADMVEYCPRRLCREIEEAIVKIEMEKNATS